MFGCETYQDVALYNWSKEEVEEIEVKWYDEYDLILVTAAFFRHNRGFFNELISIRVTVLNLTLIVNYKNIKYPIYIWLEFIVISEDSE